MSILELLRLIRPLKHDPEIHGEDGLGGVEGLPDPESPFLRKRFVIDDYGIPVRAVEGMVNAIKKAMATDHKVTVISSGPCTNIALFVSIYPDLLDGIEQFVFMGGGVGLGNRSAVAEYNILCDPEAAQILLNVPVKKVMVPLNVTHTAIVSSDIHTQLLTSETSSTSNLRHTLSTLITFFADTYKSTFGFVDGPPLHDAVTVAYVSRPDYFNLQRYHVDVELSGTHTAGETVVDVWNYRQCDDTWGPSGKNCLVAESLYVDGFFNLFLECVARCDKVSPLNASDTIV